jgi:pantoate--beta-alanine ligase
VKRAACDVLAADPRMHVEYLEIADDAEMQPVESITGPVRVAAAVWVGRTRLIEPGPIARV